MPISIDDACQIMGKWQEKIIFEFHERYDVKYDAFSHLFYDALDRSEQGDHETKNCLLEISKDFGDISFEEMEYMVLFRFARNRIAHKKIWNPSEEPQEPQERQRALRTRRNKALECKDAVTSTDSYIDIERRDLLALGLEKCINYLYN